ncbi:MAG: oligosaccharide flippase family protein [Bacilli bacterium]
MTRTAHAIKNISFGVLSKSVSFILGFVSRTVFIYVLGATYLGINGLYSEILSMLSFAELGFGAAFTFAMYKPVANNDEKQLIKLLASYKKIYFIVALVILVGGLSLLPFLQFIVKGAKSITANELKLYYLIFLSNTVMSYFVTYKYSIVNAYQKYYIITNFEMISNIVTLLLQIIILLIFKNFTLYLLTQSLVLIISRIFISVYLNHRFPIMNKHTSEKLSENEKKLIFKESRGLMVHQFSSLAVHSTDNIIISMFTGLGVVTVGLISNYNMLITSITGFLIIIFSSVASGFGNLVAEENTKQYHKTFLELNFLNYWLYGFCCISFFVLIPPFIKLWIGEKNLIDMATFSLIIVNCFLEGQSSLYNYARNAKGDFNRDKWWSLLQAIVNLVVSIIGAMLFGLVGVYIGTVVSRLVYVIFRPYNTYEFLFNVSPKEYYLKLIKYFSVTCILCVVTYFITMPLLMNVSVLGFIVSCFIVLIFPNAIIYFIFKRSEEFNNLTNRVKNILIRGRKF